MPTISKPRLKYIVNYPRDFDNEFCVYSFDPKDLAESARAQTIYEDEQGADWITRRDAERRLARARDLHRRGIVRFYGASEIVRLREVLSYEEAAE